jgi:asparagine synthase (glutamine-hydrolysing)
LVSLINSLPPTLKVNRQNRKILLVETFKDILPKSIYNRPKKGFEIPLHTWLTNDLKEKIELEWLNLADIKNEEIFNLQEIEKLKQKLFSSNSENAASVIWAIIVFRNWYKKMELNA